MQLYKSIKILLLHICDYVLHIIYTALCMFYICLLVFYSIRISACYNYSGVSVGSVLSMLLCTRLYN